MVQCFACGVELFDWTPEADPMKQHALASPTCYYINQTKGHDFVSSIQQQQEVTYLTYLHTI